VNESEWILTQRLVNLSPQAIAKWFLASRHSHVLRPSNAISQNLFRHGMESGFYWHITVCIACSLTVYLTMPDTRSHSRMADD
jgi:hypothetical protein